MRRTALATIAVFWTSARTVAAEHGASDEHHEREADRCSRRGWLVLESGARVVAVAVDADAVWTPTLPASALRACTPSGQCARVIAVRSGDTSAAPLPGKVLLLQQRLFECSPWPTHDEQEAALVDELRRDSRLRPLLEAYQPPIEPTASFGLSRIASGKALVEPAYRWESSVATTSQLRRDGGAAALGLELSWGFTIGSDLEHPSEPIFGDSFGASVRLAWYPTATRADAPHDAGLFTIAWSPDLHNIIDPFTQSRVRVPSLLGLVTPELGWSYQRRWQSAFVRWHFPVATLLTYAWGIELRPNVGVHYASPTGGAEWFFGASFGPILRIDERD